MPTATATSMEPRRRVILIPFWVVILLAVLVIAAIVLLVWFLATRYTAADRFTESCVMAHNKFRAMHGAKPVSASEMLVKMAQERADRLAQMDTLQHLPDNPFGENLYMVSGSQQPEDLSQVDCHEATKSWYDEFDEYKFDFSRPRFSGQTGHATQVVWAETDHIGCAVSATPHNPKRQYTVCLYEPHGNIIGKFDGNVTPPLSGGKKDGGR